nr:MAG TPA: hypothetical protein [Caudoviricetes sp.]
MFNVITCSYCLTVQRYNYFYIYANFYILFFIYFCNLFCKRLIVSTYANNTFFNYFAISIILHTFVALM